MSEAEVGTTLPSKWSRALGQIEATGAFNGERVSGERFQSLRSRLANVDIGQSNPEADELRVLLAQIASFMCRPDDWLQPYKPMLSMSEGRSAHPTDISDEEVEVLRDVAPGIPDLILRARICDVVAIRSSAKSWQSQLPQGLPSGVQDGYAVGLALERLRGLRNRVGHHEQTFRVPRVRRLKDTTLLMRSINHGAADALEDLDRVQRVLALRPQP